MDEELKALVTFLTAMFLLIAVTSFVTCGTPEKICAGKDEESKIRACFEGLSKQPIRE